MAQDSRIPALLTALNNITADTVIGDAVTEAQAALTSFSEAGTPFDLQAGLASFGAGTQTIVVESLGSNVTIPISLFPDFTNDAGELSFGGAVYISVFEEAVPEGDSGTGTVVPQTQVRIDQWGGIIVNNPDVSQLYEIRLRLRSELADVNFKDLVVRFRLTTPLGIPFGITNYAADQEPDITETSGEFNFVATAGTFPDGEIRLYDGYGGIVLPSGTGNWSDEAKQFMASMFGGRLRQAPITIDFAPGTGVDGWMRVVYWVVFESNTGTYAFTKYRRRSFTAWGWFNASDTDFLTASVDMVNNTATATFVRGLYALGARFQGIYAIGRAGTVAIDPKAAVTGATIDISAAVDFSDSSHLSVTGLADKFVTFFFQSPDRYILKEIPLRPTGQWDLVGSDGVTNYFTEFGGNALPAQPPLFCRILFGEYLEFPNLSTFYDATTGFLAVLPGTTFPQISNIQIFEENNAVASVVFADAIDLFNNLYTVEMPKVGTARPVLYMPQPRRDATLPNTAITTTAAFIRIVMTVDPDGVSAPYDIEAWYELNQDGQPTAWKLPAAVVADAPILTFSRATNTLDIEIPLGSNITTNSMRLRGDIGQIDDLVLVTGGLTPGTTTTVPSATIDLVTSLIGEMLEVEYETDDTVDIRRFRKRVAMTTDNVLVQGAAGNEIQGFFTGNSIMFTDLTPVTVNAAGKQEVALLGEGPPQVLRDADTTRPYFFNGQSGSTIPLNQKQPWIDAIYDVAGVTHRYRFYNNMVDARTTNPQTLAVVPSSPWAGSRLDFQLTNFSAPRVRFNLNSLEIEFDSEQRVFDFVTWIVWNLRTGAKAEFRERPEAGVRFNVGEVLQTVSVGEHLLFAAQHRIGAKRCFVVEVKAYTDGFVTMSPVDPEPLL